MRKTVTLQKIKSRTYNKTSYYKFSVNIPEKMIVHLGLKEKNQVMLISDGKTIVMKKIKVTKPK